MLIEGTTARKSPSTPARADVDATPPRPPVRARRAATTGVSAGVQRGAKLGTAGAESARAGVRENWIMRHKLEGTAAVIAHRGNVEHGDAPNSIAALERAAKDGRTDAVEMDIMRLRDGTLIVYHDGDDPDISKRDRMRMTREDLAKHPQISTLEQWAERAGELDVNVMAEFKGAGYEREALQVLQRHIDDDQLAMMSFDPDAVRAVHELDPDVPVALVIARGPRASSVAKQVDELGFRPDFVEVVRENINEGVLDDMTSKGVGIIVGKENAREQDALLDDPRISGLITNRPTQAARLRDDELSVGPFGMLLPVPGASRR